MNGSMRTRAIGGVGKGRGRGEREGRKNVGGEGMERILDN